MLLERPPRYLSPLLIVLGFTATSVFPEPLNAENSQQQDAERYGGKTLDEWIVQAKQGRRLEDRENALQIVRNFGLRHDREKTLRTFTELLSDKALTVRSLSAAGLRKAGKPTDPMAAAQLVEIICRDLSGLKFPRGTAEIDYEFGLVLRVISALEVIGEAENVPALQRVSENPGNDSTIRLAAERAIRQIDKRASAEPVRSAEAPADDASDGNEGSGDKEVIENKTLVVTVFDKPLYLEDLTPAHAEVKRRELPQPEFDEWLRQFRGARTYDNVLAAVTRRYIEREKLEVTKEEFAAVIASVERQLKSEPALREDAPITPEARKGIAVAWQRASLQDWKLTRSLYEKYGGRVGMGSLGAWIAFDGQNALLHEHYKAGDIKFHHTEMEKAFWEQTRKKNLAGAYPTGERLKWLLATPPCMWDQADNKSADKAKAQAD